MLRLGIAISAFVMGTSAVRADDRDDEIAKLKARLDALEQKAAPEAELPIRPVDLLTQPVLPAVPVNPYNCTPLPKPETKTIKMEATWKNALWFESPDKAFKWNVGGVIQYDSVFYAANRNVVQSVGSFNNFVEPSLGLQDGMEFRRARLRFAGTLYEQVEFYAQYEFAQSLDLRRRSLGISPTPAAGTNPTNDYDPGDDVGFNEVYVGLTKIPYLGTVRFGRHRESLNFVTATSDTNQVWMERGMMFDAFNGDFNFSNGITMANNWLNDRVYGFLGFFHSNNNSNRGFYALGDGEYAYDARLSGLLAYDEMEKLWVHLGADYSYRNPHQNQLRYRTRADERSGPSFEASNILNTGTIFTPDGEQIFNGEFAMASGRFTCAAEATTSWVTNAYTGGLPRDNGTLPPGVVSRGTYRAYGGYVEALCFLTPDHRKYVKDRPGYARVVPEDVFYLKQTDTGLFSTRGAWEVGMRYEYLDLTDSGINGGASNAASLCLNWYLNANTRVQANYTWMDRSFSPGGTAGTIGGAINAFGIRFNVDF
jgi:phosphate-selective porin OprO/OprP